MMEEQIARFSEQFTFEPTIEHEDALGSYRRFVVCGMGGSNLGSWLLQQYGPVPELFIHRGYGLPDLGEGGFNDTLVLACSYSGETEETLDAATVARERGIPLAVITTGGRLATFARAHQLPLIILPREGVEPRMAVGLFMLATARLMRNSVLEASIRDAGSRLDARAAQDAGRMLAKKLVGMIPVVYASEANASLAYFWKIAFNETAKTPAFENVFPEVCHNELSGFDVVETTRSLSAGLQIILLKDENDHPRIQKRMRVMHELLATRGIQTSEVELEGVNFTKAFTSILSGVWTALALAGEYGVPDAATPLIAEFKKEMNG